MRCMALSCSPFLTTCNTFLWFLNCGNWKFKMQHELHWLIKRQKGLDEQFVELIQSTLFAMDKILNNMLRDMTGFSLDR